MLVVILVDVERMRCTFLHRGDARRTTTSHSSAFSWDGTGHAGTPWTWR